MSILRYSRRPGFNAEQLLRPEAVVVIGRGRLADQVTANLAQSGFPGVLPDGATLPAADVAIIATEGEPIGPVLARLAAANIWAALVLGLAPDVLAAQAATGVRVLGPGSFGIACPALHLNATLSHLAPRPGRVALVSQSAALCRAVLDWAEPNGVGFSTIVGIGGNAGVGFAQTLDVLARDPGVGPILLDIRRIRNRRAFLSAARAAARLRPVVAIRAGGRLLDPSGRAEAVFDAALTRAGVLTVSGLDGMLAAAETLTRAPALRGDTLTIVSNAIGPGQMAADAALASGVALTSLAPETRQVLELAFPGSEAADIVYVGVAAPTRLAEAAALLGGAREVGGVLVVLAPTGPADSAGIAALVATPRGRLPLLACVMGETTGAAHRRALAAAGIPAFASPEQAVQGFRHLLRDRRARAAARELPPRAVLTIEPDRAAVRAALAAPVVDAAAVLAAYGLTTGPALPIGVADDPLFGPSISLGEGRMADRAFDLPPLNLPLAHHMVEAARDARALPAAGQAALADALVRVSQLVIDFPAIASLRAAIDGASLALRPPGETVPLAISPYPAELATEWDARGIPVTVRPIRPEDAAEHAALFKRLTPEDVRYRFFSSLRELSPERIARMTQVDYDREMAFVAINAAGQTVGVARLVRDGAGGEFAVLIEPSMKGHGLASYLMARLIDWGRSEGMAAITGQILSENAPMLAFIRRLGFTLHRMPDDPELVEARLDVANAE